MIIRSETCSRNSYGSRAQRAVMKSMVSTARNAITYSYFRLVFGAYDEEDPDSKDESEEETKTDLIAAAAD